LIEAVVLGATIGSLGGEPVSLGNDCASAFSSIQPVAPLFKS
jgi:hypothetical protein